MSDTNTETIADIIAERRAFEFITSGMRGFKKINKEYKDYTDRLDAARRREVREVEDLFHKSLKKQEDTLRDQYEALVRFSDCAKLREALEAYIDLWDNGTQNDLDELKCVINEMRAALAAPPRNCDAMDWRTAWKIWREKFHPETPAGYSAVVKGTEAFMDWFTAPATEKEGGAK
ncbi:MAG: hypothetical protein K6G94_01525 [Kiritimatiellae bacterium]|nr:hypothetical protein [Kiritimatiellia bacterium]